MIREILGDPPFQFNSWRIVYSRVASYLLLYCIFLDAPRPTLLISLAVQPFPDYSPHLMLGVSIAGTHCDGSPTCADHLSSITDSPTALQLLLDSVDLKWKIPAYKAPPSLTIKIM